MGGEGCCGSKGVRQRGDARAELYSFVGTLSLYKNAAVPGSKIPRQVLAFL